MQKITPFLWFDNQAEEAAKFYTTVFKDSKIVDGMHLEDEGIPGGSATTVTFELFGQQFIALNGGPEFNFTEAVSFMVACDSQDEVDYYWNTLTANGGEESMCGWLKDKYGLSWQIVPTVLNDLITDKDTKKAHAALQAMLQMKKLDIAALQKAHDAA